MMSTPVAPKAGVPKHPYPPRDEKDVSERYSSTVNNDPFPSLAPALLNAADLYDYVRAVGMIYPFSGNRLKSASYAAAIGHHCISWSAGGELRERHLKDQETFTLEPNSITFITTKEFFRLPNYIAMRFNLKINNVHRGILLGTGPLVDPGFQGRLLIPLHNLTTNTYYLTSGDSFIWVEFTKISPNPEWASGLEDLRQAYALEGKYVPFPREKIDRKPWDYLNEAHGGAPIRSSIPEATREAKEMADKAHKTAQRFSWGTVIGGLVMVLGVLMPLFAVLFDDVRDLMARQFTLGTEQESMKAVFVTRSELTELERLGELEERLDKLERSFANGDLELNGVEPDTSKVTPSSR